LNNISITIGFRSESNLNSCVLFAILNSPDSYRDVLMFNCSFKKELIFLTVPYLMLNNLHTSKLYIPLHHQTINPMGFTYTKYYFSFLLLLFLSVQILFVQNTDLKKITYWNFVINNWTVHYNTFIVYDVSKAMPGYESGLHFS
jgi:hypothetical protein